MVFWFLDIFFVFFPIAWLWREKGFKKPLSKKKMLELLEALGLKRDRITEVIKNTVLLFLSLLIVTIIIGIAVTQLGLNDTALVREKVLELRAVPWLVVYILTVRVTGEEVFFRGFLVPKIGVLGSTALFGLMHFAYGSIAEIIGAFVLGILLAAFFKRSKNLFPNIFAHSMYDLGIFLV